MESTEPVVVLYKSEACGHCKTLWNIWNQSNNGESVTSELKKVYPKIRIFVATSKEMTGKFDENIYPKGLYIHKNWFPKIILVPGKLWNEAMSKLGPTNDVKLINGVQVMNGQRVGDTFKPINMYNIFKPSEFSRWLKDAMQNDEFKKYQYSGNSDINIPKKQDLINKTNVNVGSSKNAINNSPTYRGIGHTNDICTMRIISRRR